MDDAVLVTSGSAIAADTALESGSFLVAPDSYKDTPGAGKVINAPPPHSDDRVSEIGFTGPGQHVRHISNICWRPSVSPAESGSGEDKRRAQFADAGAWPSFATSRLRFALTPLDANCSPEQGY